MRDTHPDLAAVIECEAGNADGCAKAARSLIAPDADIETATQPWADVVFSESWFCAT